jgi:tripartite-type tricarboxylate transporter receptor subunit TctC
MEKRRLTFRRWIILGACLACWALISGNTLLWSAERDYPNKPITFIINFPPGSSADVCMRVAHPMLQELLGVPVVLENKPGTGGALAADFVIKSKPDGYTILAGGNASLTTGPVINQEITYKYTDFAPICAISADYSSITARPDPSYKTLDEFVAYAKKNPGKLNCATAGMGSVSHLYLEFVKLSYGLDIVAVHFQGTPPAKNALMGGHVNLASSGLGAFIPVIKSGDINLLVTGASKRLKDFPDVPTLAEKGFPSALNIWNGIFAPAKVPKAVVEKLTKVMEKVYTDPGTISKIEKAGLQPDYRDAEGTQKLLDQEYSTVSEVVKKVGIGK